MNIQINNIHSTNSLSIIKALSRIEKYDIIVIGSDIYKKGECAGSLLVDKYYQAPPITQEAEVKLFMMRQLLQSQRISVIYINYLDFVI